MIKVNLCGVGLEGFVNVDISLKADKIRDLSWMRIPFDDNSVDVLICMSAINYFTKKRAQFLINDVHRVLKPDGVCRFGVQDLQKICSQYLIGNPKFNCENINRWFNSPETDGFKASGKRNKYVYDYKTLSAMFSKFLKVSPKLDAGLPFFFAGLRNYDNRPEQMFFLEAMK